MEECIVCFDETDEFIFYTCTHKLCINCYRRLNNCPLCQANKPLEIVIHTSSNTVTSIFTTYIIIKCIGIFFLIATVFIYLYNIIFI
jgi:hypothetical protein